MIRVHRQQIYTANSANGDILLQQLKWPIEYLFVGMKVKNYHASSDAATRRQHLDKWHTFHSRSTQTYTTTGQNVAKESLLVADPTTTLGIDAAALGVSALSGTALTAVALTAGDLIRVAGMVFRVNANVAAGAALLAVPVNIGSATAVVASAAIAAGARKVENVGLQVETQRCTRTLNNLSISAHGIDIYNNFPMGFFNAYTSYHYGGPNINAPEDCGLAFVPFCLYPGTYQPSGHINVSRAREFYLKYDSSVINGSVEGSLVVLASAINFLLISDGSAVLRYST